MSELLHAGKTLAEIAGYDDYFLRRVLALPRDRHGRLVRGEPLPEGVEVDEDGMRVVSNPVPYGVMFRRVKRSKGVPEPLIDREWKAWLRANPTFGKGGPEN